MNTYLIVAGEIALEEHQLQALESLQASVLHFEQRRESIIQLIEFADGLVVLPGWENHPRALLEVQIAKAFRIPVKTHTRWLMTLPTPDPDIDVIEIDILPDLSRFEHAIVDAQAAREMMNIDLVTGGVMFGDAVIDAEGAAHFAEVVNLEPDPEPPVPTAPWYDPGECPTGGKHRWKVLDGAFGCEECGAAA